VSLSKRTILLNKRIILALFVALVTTWASPAICRADAQADLTAGRAALDQGDLEQANKLLSAAAVALPQSVEAQLALAECRLKLGQLDKALEKYREVLKLSPDHPAAKKIVEGLQGSGQTFSQRLETAAMLIKLGAFAQAEAVARQALALPVEPAQRAEARLLLARTLLLLNSAPALDEAVRVIQDGPHAAEARVVAALALLVQPEPNLPRVDSLLRDLPEIPAATKPLRDLALLLVKLEDDALATEVSSKLAATLKDIPASPFRTQIENRAFMKLSAAAQQKIQRSDLDGALQILWPMVSSGPLPTSEDVLKDVKLQGGWIDQRQSKGQLWAQVGQLLGSAGTAESQRQGANSTFLGQWLGAQVLLQATQREAANPAALQLAASLMPLSRVSENRKLGEPLSLADSIQAELLRQLLPHLAGEEHLQHWINLAVGQMERYDAAGDSEAGLAEFSPLPWNARRTMFVASGPSRLRWMTTLARKCADIGAKKFAEAAATLAPDANEKLNVYDQTALWIIGDINVQFPQEKGAPQLATEIVDRYLQAEKFVAATAATKALFAFNTNAKAVEWSLLRLKIRQAQFEEQQLLAGNRKLAAELNPLVKEALAAAFEVLKAHPTKEHRRAVIGLLNPLVERYAGFDRRDLADAVIALAAETKLEPLADWVLWTNANLQGRDAARTFAAAASEAADPAKLTIIPQHQAELELLLQIIAKHPASEYFPLAVKRISQLAELYHEQRASDAAGNILAQFLKAHPKLENAPQLEYQALEIRLAQAQRIFNERKDKVKPPEKISAEYQAAVNALAAYLKAHPTGDHSPAVLMKLLEVARIYGSAGAWPVAREVLARFAAVAPDYRSPGQMKLWVAATYLGELDLPHGLNLLTPQIPGGGHSHGTADPFGVAASTPQPTVAAGPATGTAGFGVGGGAGGKGIANQPPALNGIAALPEDSPFGDFEKSAGGKEDKMSGDLALLAIRNSEKQHLSQVAMLKDERNKLAQGQPPKSDPAKQPGESSAAIALPSGPLLSDAEMKRQDTAADQAYAILIDLVKTTPLNETALAESARGQILWIFTFFEGQLRTDRTVAYIKKFLTDRPSDPQRVAIAFRALQAQLTWAGQKQKTDRVNKAWLDSRHELFEAARREIAKFVKTYADKQDWAQQGRILAVDSYDREAMLAMVVSPDRSAGLLVNSVEALVALYEADPAHPAIPNFPERMWQVSERLRALKQEDLAVQVLSQIPRYFPMHNRAQQAVLRIAELYATNLTSPLRAVETYQEYLSVGGDNEAVRAQIYSIAQQLAAKQRYLEALHVFGVFVDSFPTDARAPEALRAIGGTHQANEVWKDALAAYERILVEFPNAPITPQVKLAMAECKINLSEWSEARELYAEFAAAYPQDAQITMVQQRMEILKNLNRYQTLLEDNDVQRNKDDAQYQIGVIVNERLNNHLKAIEEFRKVVSEYPKSSLAASAQFEIGKAYLKLNRLEEARKELFKVPQNYAGSPLADDALYFIGQSYEQQAQKLAGITIEKAKADAFVQGQRAAYSTANMNMASQEKAQSARRGELKKLGKTEELALDEASIAFRQGTFANAAPGAAALVCDYEAETVSALQLANRQDRINDAYRQSVATYSRVANEYPLGDMTDKSLLRMAQILETELKDKALAMATYQKVVKFFPGTPVAEDAAWKVAKFYEGEGKYKEAVDSYREFIRTYPASGRVADAQFAVAEALEQLGRWVEAMDAYETFRQKFTGHPKAQVAQDQINWIRAYRK
jgi:TolA-binding protein